MKTNLFVFMMALFSLTSLANEIPIHFKGDFTSNQRDKLTAWVNDAIKASKTVHGSLPMKLFSVVVKPSRWSRGTVPWGEVDRDDTPKVTLVVNPNASLDSLKRDWTIYHELSHLYIPYDGYGPRWLSEGLASYYQNIIQYRAGLINNKSMWYKLVSGFERGKKQTSLNNKTLAYVSDNIGENRQYMRVYWSGALYWLSMDVAIRKGSKGKQSLDSLLKELKNCCQHKQYSGWQIVRKLDHLSQTNLFTQEYKTFAYSYHIPNYNPLLADLGVVFKNGGIDFNDKAKHAEVRIAIEGSSKVR